MSERVTELLSRVQKLEDELKDSERKRMDLIQSNAALQKILKACQEQEVRAQLEIASLACSSCTALLHSVIKQTMHYALPNKATVHYPKLMHSCCL